MDAGVAVGMSLVKGATAGNGRPVTMPFELMKIGDSFVTEWATAATLRVRFAALAKRYGRVFSAADLPGLGMARVWCLAYVDGVEPPEPVMDDHLRLLAAMIEKNQPAPEKLLLLAQRRAKGGGRTGRPASYDWKGLPVGESFASSASYRSMRVGAKRMGERLGRQFVVRREGTGSRVWCVGVAGERPVMIVPRTRRTLVERDPELSAMARKIEALEHGAILTLWGDYDRIKRSLAHASRLGRFAASTYRHYQRHGVVRITRIG